jgi:aminoglycoside phosphotransferase
MDTRSANPLEDALHWCASILGPVEVDSDHTREHPGERAGALRLRSAAGLCYLKIHRDPAHWTSEAHAYEHWAPAFGAFAPQLLGVRAEAPLALLISALPGKVLEETQLSAAQHLAVWRSAGRALAGLHNSAVGSFFGPVRRDGTCAGTPITGAVEWVDSQFDDWLSRGERIGALAAADLAVVRAARRLTPVFAGEHPTPCHRDYCPANWLVTPAGGWAGVIDFEFSYWDVRAADYTRYPEWTWIDHPERIQTFFEGYGRAFTPAEEQQRQVCLVLYALGALVWGQENGYRIFAAEGRRALEKLGEVL